MSKVRVPLFGTVGKSVRVNPDATYGAQFGIDLFDEQGNIATLASLAAQVYRALAVSQKNATVFETQIIDGTILARVGDDETITGTWTFDNEITVNSVSSALWVQNTRALTAGAGLTGGGNLSADRTFDVGAGTGITVNADDVALSAASIASLALADTSVQPGDNVSDLTNDAGYLTAESDPVFGASAAAGISAGDISNWNTAFGWGDHSAAGYADDSLVVHLAGTETITGAKTFTGGFTASGILSYFKHTGSQINIQETDAADPNDRTILEHNSGYINLYWYDSSVTTYYNWLKISDAGAVSWPNAGSFTLDDAYFRIATARDAGLASTNHSFQIGDSASTNLRMDNNEIMVVNNGVAGTLYINADGGQTTFNLNAAGKVIVDHGSELWIRDSGLTDYVKISHDGTDLNWDFTNTTNLNLTGLTNAIRIDSKEAIEGSDTWLRLNQSGDFTSGVYVNSLMRVDGGVHHIDNASAKFGSGQDVLEYFTGSYFVTNLGNVLSTSWQIRNATFIGIYDGASLDIYNSGNTDSGSFYHNGTDFYEDYTNTTWKRVTGLGTGVLFLDGAQIRTYDSTNVDYMLMRHDGTYGYVSASGASLFRLTGATAGYRLETNGRLWMQEVSADSTDYAAYGQLWVRDDAPNTLWFTDDTGGPWALAGAFRNITGSTNTAATDAGLIIRMTSGSGATFTLDGDPPTNAVIVLDNSSGNSWTIAASTTLIWAADASTGSRTLADDGLAVALHRGGGVWVINGGGLS